MRAAVLREYGEGPSIEQVDRPAVGPRDALVAVATEAVPPDITVVAVRPS